MALFPPLAGEVAGAQAEVDLRAFRSAEDWA